ncbi:unnamed protein product [Spirodela intermedia]|uniref:Peroxisomal ATPase PEX6 n=1 Tax=Spirodela intermedia TaxID=51605 RepID=A0A7I8JEM0_SPIIN|nr:unnamed protein product [Spirodela intermedia]CAA6668577.1 unnamed protein product [Spirodela intermedia]
MTPPAIRLPQNLSLSLSLILSNSVASGSGDRWVWWGGGSPGAVVHQGPPRLRAQPGEGGRGGGGGETGEGAALLPAQKAPPPAGLRLRAGILRRGGGAEGEPEVLADTVGVSASALKSLSLTSGSLILIKNTSTNVGRVARILALGQPERRAAIQAESPSQHLAMGIFPLHSHDSSEISQPDGGIAYISPLLAFSMGLHLSAFNVLLHGGKEGIESLFSSERRELDRRTAVSVELAPLSQVPRYASHLRISFVRTPECSLLESLRGSSPTEVPCKGDVFGVNLNWNCCSEMCVACSRKDQRRPSADLIYFKVVAMEPLEDHILRANCRNTALVLGGHMPSPVPPHSLMDAVRNMASIFVPTLCPSALSSKLRVALLLFGPADCGKRTVVRYVAHCLGLHLVEYSCHDLMSASEKKASIALAHAFSTAQRYAPSILLLRNFEVFGKLQGNDGSPSDQVAIVSEIASVVREFTEPLPEEQTQPSSHVSKDDPANGQRVLLVAAANNSDGLQPSIRRCFSHELNMNPLSEAQRGEMLLQSVEGVSNGQSHQFGPELLKDIIGQTSGFMPRDIRALVADAGAMFVSRLPSSTEKFGAESSNGSRVIRPLLSDEISGEYGAADLCKDLSKALERSKKRNASALGTPKVPNVKWEDVGGLEEVKRSILDTVQLPLLHKELFSSGLRKRSGVLLYGPPGTGKTLLAKAVATECSLNFLSVKGPELINMYIGESEKNVRDIFEKARSARPCVIFFDELDSLAPARGASGDSGGVMDRVVSQMLAEIDGLSESKQDLFIIGASNRPDLIDPALLRPGRFDKLLYVGVNTEASKKERVLVSLTRKFKLHKNVSLSSVAKRCPPNFTGADMYALCTDAWFHAAKRKASPQLSDSEGGVIDDPNAVIVELDDFVKLSPSLSISELRKYEQLRSQFEGGK